MQVYANLRQNLVVKIKDFSENYLFSPRNPEFTLDTKLMHSLVALRKVNGKIEENHFVVISV